MGGFDDLPQNLRRAYAAGRDSMRARARARVAVPGDDESAGDPLLAVVATSAADDLDVPRGLRVAGSWAWRVLLLVLAGAALLWLVARLQLVIVPLIIAVLLSALLSPLVARLRQLGLPRSLATAVVLVTGIAAVVGTLTLAISEFVNGFPNLSANASRGVQQVQDWLMRTGPLHLTQTQLDEIFKGVRDWLDSNRDSLTTGALSTATTLTHVLAGLFLVLFATFFFLRDGRRISHFVISLLPERARARISSAADASWVTLVSYVRATVLVAFIDAVGIGTALLILRVQFALPLAALVFLGAFIPIIGATLSGAVAVLVALVDKGAVVALLTMAAVIAVQQLEGHVLQPLIMGRAVAIHPLAVIVAIATGAVLAGIVGALVAVPIVAMLNTAIRHLGELRRVQEDSEPPGLSPPTVPAPSSPSATSAPLTTPAPPSPSDGPSRLTA